jgi:hypothetical protein
MIVITKNVINVDTELKDKGHFLMRRRYHRGGVEV